MSRNLALTVAMLVAAGLVALTGALYDLYRPAPGEAVTTTASQTIPNFAVTTLSGKTIHITDLRGKVVILNFWATWCAPCVVEFPTLINIVHKYKGDVVLLALSSDRDRAVVEKFMATQRARAGHTFDSDHIITAIDENRNLTRDVFKITTYPETLIIGPDGKIVRHIIGTDAWADPETTAQINRLIPKKGK